MHALTNLLRIIFYFICRTILALQFKITVKGRENIPPISRALIVANHSSYLDVFVIAFALYNNLINLHWIISKANYNIWQLRWFYWFFPVIVVNGTVEKAKKALAENRWIVIFPEGAGRWCCIQDGGKKIIPGKGASVIALSTGAPIIPIGICGSDKALSPGKFKLNRKETVEVNIGKPFSFGIVNQERIDDSLIEKTTNEIMQRIYALLPGQNS